MKKGMKRILSLLLCITMVVGLLPMTVSAATCCSESAEHVHVAGVQLTDGQYLAQGASTATNEMPTGGYAHFYVSGNESILELSNYTYTVTDGSHHCIHFDNALTIELLPGTTSSVTNGYTVAGAAAGGSDGTVAIQGEGSSSLTIRGAGTLNATGYMHGIWAMNWINIYGGATVNATATIPSTETDAINSIALATNRYGTIEIGSSTVNAIGGNYGIGCSNSGLGKLNISSDSKVTATGNTAAVRNVSVILPDAGYSSTASMNLDGSAAEAYDAAELNNYKYIAFGTPYSPEVTNYNLWIGDTQVTSANASDVLGDSSVYFNAAANELVLAGFNGTSGGSQDAVIYAMGMDLTLSLAADYTNTISGATDGIKVSSGDLTIAGAGALNLVGNGGSSVNSGSGIYTTGHAITISGGANVSLSGYAYALNGDAGITIDGTDTKVEAYGSKNAAHDAITINACPGVTLKGDVRAVNSSVRLVNVPSITASTNVDGSGAVEYNASDRASYKFITTALTAAEPDYTLYLKGGKVYKNNVNGGEVTNSGITGTGNDADGYTYTFNNVNFTTTATTAVEVADSDANITIELVGENNLLGGASGSEHTNYGLYISGNGNGLTIRGEGTLNATGGYSSARSSYGIDVLYCPVTVESGTINATGGRTASQYDYSTGFGCSSTLTVNGGSITATGNKANYSRGIHAVDGFTVNGGTVIGISGDGTSSSYGIYSPYSLVVGSDMVVYDGEDETSAVEKTDWNGKNGGKYMRIEEAPQSHTHCVCGLASDICTDPTHSDVTYTEITQAYFDELAAAATGNSVYLPEGNYYLAEDITLSKHLSTTSGKTLKLCLNGKTISGGAGYRLNVTYRDGMDICDCGEGGTVTTRAMAVDNSGTLNVYGGTFVSTSSSVGAVVGSSSVSVTNIFGGTFTSNSYAAFKINYGKLYLFGSPVINAGTNGHISVNKESSAAIYASANGKAYSGGELTVYFEDVSVKLGKEVVYGVNSENEDKFTVKNAGYFFLNSNNNLVLKEAHIHEADGTGNTGITYSFWNFDDTSIEIDSNVSYVLYENADCKGITVKTGATVNLCLGGYALNLYETAITVEEGGILNICDCGGRGRIVSADKVIINNGGEINLYSGEINGGYYGISNNSGTVNAYGGTVIGSEKAVYGTVTFHETKLPEGEVWIAADSTDAVTAKALDESNLDSYKKIWVDIPAHAHCICGEETVCVGHSEVIYLPITSTAEFNTLNTSANGNYYLAADIEYTYEEAKEIDSDVNLCLNGHTLDLGDYRFRVNNGAEFKVCDCSESGNGKITSNETVIYSTGGAFTLYGGELRGISRGQKLGSCGQHLRHRGQSA